jgi:hypothetical protein
MERTTSRISLVLAGAILLAAGVALTTVRPPEDCRPPEIVKSHAIATAADAPTPTLAPPQKVVFVRVEADKSDIEVGWAEN